MFGGVYWAQGGGGAAVICYGDVTGHDFARAFVVVSETAARVTGVTARKSTVTGGDRRREGC